VGRRPRQRPAALRNAGEPGGLLRRTRSRRQDPLARSEPRRPPLAHGHPANFTGQIYEVEQYEVDADTGYIDYEGLREAAEEFEPDIVVSGYSAYPRTVDWEEIQAAADAVDAYHLADIAHITGLVAAGVHPRRSASPTSSPARRTRRSGPVAAGS